MSYNRKPWDIFFMGEAYNYAKQSTCLSRHVGCIFVKGNVPIAWGFNGVPSGSPHPQVCWRKEKGLSAGQGLDLCDCLHAEDNAVALNSRMGGAALAGSTVYCTSKPCKQCMGRLANVGVIKVIFDEDYPHEQTDKIAEHGNIEIVSFRQLWPDAEEYGFTRPAQIAYVAKCH